MKLTLDIRKSLEQNAAAYFEDAKKAKGKLDSVRRIIAKSEQELLALDEKEAADAQKKEPPKARREKKWFEKFRWFISSESFLCIGGRDATTNEIVVKKHTDPADVVFHADLSGSPFFIVKSEGKAVGERTLAEAAQATASFSRGWKQGLGYLDVFHVAPEQVTKEARAGEFVAKGAFMIYGKKAIIRTDLKLAIGRTEEGLWMCGPPSAVRTHCKKYALIATGKDKPSDAAKFLRKKFGGEPDDIIRALPPGPVRVSNPKQ